MKKFMAAFVMVITFAFLYGMGESIIAQRDVAAHYETLERREELVDEFKEKFAAYGEAADGDYRLHVTSVDDDGIHFEAKAFVDGQLYTGSGDISWDELESEFDELDAYTMAELYSV